MKDFIKWLGVNEKVAKVVVWLSIIMVFLIIINTALNSLGFPHYAITYDNLKSIDIGEAINFISSLLVCGLNFYATAFLIFSVKEYKDISKYAILYVSLNCLVSATIGYVGVQIYILLFYIIFCYLYSNKNKKYIIYGMLSLLFNTVIQGIMYTYKLQLIDINEISRLTRSILSMDYFIIMAVIILVKEIYLKKRGEK